MKWLASRLPGLLGCLAELAVGILLICSPLWFFIGLFGGGGAVLLIVAAVFVLRYFFGEVHRASERQWLFKGLLAATSGVLLIVYRSTLMNSDALILWLFAVVLLVTGLYKVQWAADAVRLHKGRWFMPLISAILTLGSAAVWSFYPFTSGQTLLTTLGVLLIAQAVSDGLSVVLVNEQQPDEPRSDDEDNAEEGA